MSFKHQIKKDINRNFFREFAERINFCGISVKALLNFKNQKGRKDSSIKSNTASLVFLKRDLPIKINIDEKITINSETYFVKNIKDELGLLEIDIERWEE